MSLVPPFTEDIARQKVKKAQDLWNTKCVWLGRIRHKDLQWSYRDPEAVSKAYTEDTIWRNRDTFLSGTQAVKDFLVKKWQREKNYKLRKELFAFGDNKIAVQFWYEYQDASDGMKWKRCYGLEDWTFADDGRMRKRQMSGNDVELTEADRWYQDGVDVNTVQISEKDW